MASRNSDSSDNETLVDEKEQAGLLSFPENDYDVEKASTTPPTINHEHTVSTRRKLLALAGYFFCNVGLTIYNKAVLGSFPFPWLLTALHAGCSSIGCLIMLKAGFFSATKLTSRESLALVAFSFLFTINIAISNVSLAMVSVPFHQVVRATTPLVTTFVYRTLYSRTFSTATYLSLVPIVSGVAFTTYGDYSFTTLGLLLTILGVVLAALKTIVTNRMMTGTLSLSFWEILLRMSPLAFIQSLIYAVVLGEVKSFYTFLQTEYLAPPVPIEKHLSTLLLVLAGNGILAFMLNVSSFSTNKIVGALTMTVCANIKQCLTIVLGIALFNVHLSVLNAWGIVMTVAGGVLYSFVELDSKRKKKRVAQAAVGGSQ